MRDDDGRCRAMLVVVHCQWCRSIVHQTQNSRRTKWLLRRRRSRGETRWATKRTGGGEIVHSAIERERGTEGERENHSAIRG